MKSPFTSFALIFVAVIGFFDLFVSDADAEGNPEFRPGLIGNGPKSLVNLIDVQKLLQGGQQDAVVMFSAFPPGGRVFGDAGTIYNATPNSRLLQKEVLKALSKAEMIPAIANHKQVLVVFDGTVMFFAKATPHLRVFANQEPAELAHFNDFIAPQRVFASEIWDSKSEQLDAARRLGRNGVVVLSLHVDEKGKLLGAKVISEDPPGFNFGALLLKAFATAKFVPAYRNGKPTECTFRSTQFIRTRP